MAPSWHPEPFLEEGEKGPFFLPWIGFGFLMSINEQRNEMARR
jgi:hypothetical protein